jgi:predicted phosphodiesterase
MHRIAVIADIHGNVPALRAVLDDLDRQSLDEVIVGGDLVGRGPQGSRIVDIIADRGWPTIRGNHEDYLLSFRRKDVPDDWLEADEWAASRWMAAELDDEHAEFVDQLPMAYTSSVAPGLRVVHGSPESYTDGIGPWLDQSAIARRWNQVDESVLVCAHTHRPLIRQIDRDSGIVVNVGSVGLPFNGDPRAQYAILEHSDGRWDVEFRQVEYDRDHLIERYHDTGFLTDGGITAEVLLREVREARPFLVPFLEWCKLTGRDVHRESFDTFLTKFDPADSIGAFLRQAKETSGS